MPNRLHGISLALVLALGCGPKPDEGPQPRAQDSVKRLTDRHASLKEEAAAADLVLGRQLQAEVEKLSPDPSLGLCKIDRVALGEQRLEDFGRDLIIHRGKPIEKFFGPASRTLARTFDDFEDAVVRPVGEEDKLGRKLEDYVVGPPTGYYVILVIDVELEAKSVDKDSFEPGMLAGELFVWDADAGELVCGAPVLSQSSEEIQVTRYSLGDQQLEHSEAIDNFRLRKDLRNNAIKAGLEALSLLGPRPEEGAEEPAEDTEEPKPKRKRKQTK